MRRVAESGAIDLALGIPGFAPEPQLVEYMMAALRGGVHQYEQSEGSPLLRAAVSQWLRHDRGIAVAADDITITCGATEALFVALRAVVQPGDDVVIVEPAYEGFAAAAAMCGVGVRIACLEPPNWRLDVTAIAQSITPATRALIINTPHNPTGRVFGRDELAELGALCTKKDIYCISDEVYEAFGGATVTSALEIASLKDRTLALGSFSKTLAVSGWRVGYLVTPPRLTGLARRYHQAATTGAPSAAQDAVGRFVADIDAFHAARERVASHVRTQGLRAASIFATVAVRPLPGGGGCFFIAELRDETAAAFCARLVEQHGVAVAPGTAFWSDPSVGSHFVRVAFNKAEATISEAEHRLSGRASQAPQAPDHRLELPAPFTETRTEP